MLVCLIASENFLIGDSSDDDRSDQDKERPQLLRLRIAELCPQASGHSEAKPKERCNPRPSRKRVVQRDCFQGATDFSERVLQRARAQKQSAAVELALPAAAARAKER